jgi:hypothetical protein
MTLKAYAMNRRNTGWGITRFLGSDRTRSQQFLGH